MIEAIAEKRGSHHDRHRNGTATTRIQTDHPVNIYEDLTARFVTPVIERHREVGRAQGRAEGTQAQNELWQAWLQRKQHAEAQGLDFNEPPPGTDQNSNS